ncbi:MAG TPA: hypothetical protein VM266_02465, partial [Solirubrobacteraceae bacterium]|nr:hypothetical protein [Solirubrobacteraceae bacterium]
MRRLLIGLAVLAGAAPPAAEAATVAVELSSCTGDSCRYCGSQCETETLVFRAAPGEANRLIVRRAADAVTFNDTGASLAAGPGCTQVDAGTATCRAASSPLIRLGDRDDVLEGSDARESIDGGSGRDVLRAAGGDDTIDDGDPAADVIDGGAGRDDVSYWGRKWGVRVDLGRGTTADGDRIAGVERVMGGPGDDRLRGGPGADELYGGPGRDALAGAGGADELHGDAGTDTYRCGGGTDRVIEPSRRELLRRGCERVGSGDARTVPSQP